MNLEGTFLLFRAELDALDYVWWGVGGREETDSVKSQFFIKIYYMTPVLAIDSGR